MGHRRGAQEDESVAMGGDAGGDAGGVDGEDHPRGQERGHASSAVSFAPLGRETFQGGCAGAFDVGQECGWKETTLAGAGDAVRGKAVFEKRCTGCHAMEADREGPGWLECLAGRPEGLRDLTTPPA